MTNDQDFGSMEFMETIRAGFDYLIREDQMGKARKDALRLAKTARKRGSSHKHVAFLVFIATWDAKPAGKLLMMR